MPRNRQFLIILLLLHIVSCAGSDIFTPIGTNIAAPNGMAVDSTNKRLYLVNSNTNVTYNWQQGSVQILNITNPASPVLVNTAQTLSFSGEAYFDATQKLLYTPNRYSEGSEDNTDQLLAVNVDEASANFLNVTSTDLAPNPFGMSCCYPANRLFIASESNSLLYRNLGDLSGDEVSLLASLSNGVTLTQSEASYVAISGNQAFVPRIRGGLFVINLDEIGDSTKNPVDYFIEDVSTPNGIAANGTYLYIVDEEEIDGSWTPILLVLNSASLVPLTDNTTTQVIDKDTSGLVVANPQVGGQPQQVLLTNTYAFVTSKNDNIVSAIRLSDNIKVQDITVGDEPFGMAWYSQNNDGIATHLYVGNIESNSLSIIDIATLAVVGNYP